MKFIVFIFQSKNILPSMYPCMILNSGNIDSGGRTGRFFPQVHGGDGGGGRSKSKEGTLNLAESLATEEGLLLLDSLEPCLLLFFEEICSLIMSSSDLCSINAVCSWLRCGFTSSRSSNEDGGVTLNPVESALCVITLPYVYTMGSSKRFNCS